MPLGDLCPLTCNGRSIQKHCNLGKNLSEEFLKFVARDIATEPKEKLHKVQDEGLLVS